LPRTAKRSNDFAAGDPVKDSRWISRGFRQNPLVSAVTRADGHAESVPRENNQRLRGGAHRLSYVDNQAATFAMNHSRAA
jgi:hypothetical protein